MTATTTPQTDLKGVGGPPAAGSQGRSLLNVPQAAMHLGVSVRFIRRLVAERRITYYKVGRHLRFDRADLDNFLEAACVERVWR